MKELPVYRRVVQFADTDMAGIVHFSRILCFVEEAEQAAMDTMQVPAMGAEGGFPKVHIDCDYRSPLRYRDEVEVQMMLEQVGERSLQWRFNLSVSGQLCAEGGLVTVFVNHQGRSAKVADEWRQRLEGNE